jgi:type I restriction enzyme S subunit
MADWEVKKLEDVCNLKSGTTIPTKFEEKSGTILYIKVGDMNLVDNEICINSSSRFVDIQNVKQNQIIPKGSVIFPKRGGAIFTNKRRKITKPTIVDLNIMALVPSELINPDFLYYWFLRIDLKDLNNGSSIPQINNYSFDNTYIAYPKSITEQKRIVAILDETFKNIAKAKENAEMNLKNAKEIFESYLQSVFENKGEGWEEKKLGEVCEIIGGGTPSKANNEFYGGDIRWATVGDMKGEIITDTEYKITKDAVKNSSTNMIPKGNVIIATRVGLGKICLIYHDTAINQDLRGIVPINPDRLSVDFLYRWFKSIAHKIVEEGTGATVQGVKLPFIKSLPIYIPPFKEQQSIVAKLDALSAETKKLEVLYEKKLADLKN